MKKRNAVSLLMLLLMLPLHSFPVMADGGITVGGDVLYFQNFEENVESEMTTVIGGNAAFSVENIDGNNVLKVKSASGYGYNKFGPEYDDAVVKMDFKQIDASGSGGAYIGVGARVARQNGGAYYSNAGGYFDVIKYNTETGKYDSGAEPLRDRLVLAKTKGAKYDSFASIDAISQNEIGVLNSARNTGDEFLRLQNVISGNVLVSELKTKDGTVLESLSRTVVPYAEKGYTQLLAHGGEYVVDNIKIMKPVKVNHLAVEADEQKAVIGEETGFTVTGDKIELQPDTARYVYDNTKVKIDCIRGTVTPLKEGTHTVDVYLDDINGNESLFSSFEITGIKSEDALEVVIENLNAGTGESIPIRVYYGGADVTGEASFSGATYEDGKIIPESCGINEITVSYNGRSVTVPVAVNNKNETVAQIGTAPVFTEDFEGDAATLKTTYGRDNANFAVESVSCKADNTTDNALKMTTETLSTTVFGPTNLSDYVLEYDSLCTKATGSSVSFYGATMRAGSAHGGYKLGVTPVIVYNPTTHKVDTASGNRDNLRRTTIAYSSNSANASSWIYAGFSEAALQSSVSQGDGAKWIHHKNTIVGDIIKTELSWKKNSSPLTTRSYMTSITELNKLAGKAGYSTGGTTLATHGNTTYFDNIKIYPVFKYNDIKINIDENNGVSTISVAGVDKENNEAPLTGAVTTKAYGAAIAGGNSYTGGDGVGYVAITYQDLYGNKKYKAVKVDAVKDDNDFSDENSHGLSGINTMYESFEGEQVFGGLDIITENNNKAARIRNSITNIVYTPNKNMIIEGSFKVVDKEKHSLFEIITTENPVGDSHYGGNKYTVFSIDIGRGFIGTGKYPGKDVQIKEGWNRFSIVYLGNTACFTVNGQKMCAIMPKTANPGLRFRAEGAEILLDNIKVSQIETSTATSLAAMNQNAEVTSYEPYDFLRGSGLYYNADDGNGAKNITNLDDIHYIVTGDYKELSNGYGYFYSDSVVTFRSKSGSTCSVNIKVNNRGLTQSEYLYDSIYKRRQENAYIAYETYNKNGIPKSDATYSHLFYMLSPTYLYPTSENHDEEIEFFVEMAENTEYATRGYIGAEDFISLDLILLMQNDKLNISQNLRNRVEEFFLTLDFSNPEEALSENHRITYYAIAIAASETFDNAIFFNGLSSDENKKLYKSYILDWIDFRMKYGMGEYDSPGYYVIDFAALETIYTQTKDNELKRRVYEMLMYLYTDAGLDSNNSVIGGATLRSYVNKLKQFENPALDVVFNNFVYPEHTVAMQMMPLSYSEFVPQESLAELCADRRESYVNVEKRRIYTIPDDPKLMKTLTKYTYVTPDYIIGSLVERDDLPENAYGNLNHIYVNTGTYEKDTRILPDFQSIGFSLGIKGNPLLNIFDSHPGSNYTVTNGAHSYFSGDHGCNCARYGQYENTVLSIRHITDERLPQFSHLYINRNEFDEVVEENGWIILRSGDVYAALFPMAEDGSSYSYGNENKIFANTPLSELEIKINSADSAFVAEVYNRNEVGEFNGFVKAVSEKKPVFNGNSLEYTSYRGDLLELNYTNNELYINGNKKIYTGEFTDSTEIYLKSGWGNNEMVYSEFTTPDENYVCVYKTGLNRYKVLPINSEGVVLVAAYDENGYMSWVEEITEDKEFEVCEGSIKVITFNNVNELVPLTKQKY